MVKHEYTFLKDRLPGLKRAKIDAAGAGDNTVIAAVAGKIIRVYAVVLIAAGAVTVKFQSGASGTDLTGPLTLAANTGFSSSWSPVGLFQTAEGALLNLNLGGAVVTGGWLIYGEI